MKRIATIHRQGEAHWVGDGFPVHTVFHYQDQPGLTPFLLLDHAGPIDFAPSARQRGVGWHPHRGFETVTVVYDGEVEHEDTAGNGGRIGPGDVQWMTAGAGLLHKELHSESFAQRGGRFEVLQLWVNLPAKLKMTPPRYQELAAASIPVVQLADAGTARVIAGAFRGVRGPARTFTPIDLLDIRVKAGRSVRLELTDGYTASLYVLAGSVRINDEDGASATDLVVLQREGSDVTIDATSDATLFVMHGEPIAEPVAGYGPFVMNTIPEIQQAFKDFHAGKLGTIPVLEEIRS